MADSDTSKKNEETEFSPEELAEIRRIADIVDDFDYAAVPAVYPREPASPPEAAEVSEGSSFSEPPAETPEGEDIEPEDLNLPQSTLNVMPVLSDDEEEPDYPEPSEKMSDLPQDGEQALDDIPEELSPIAQGIGDDSQPEVLDITGLIQDMQSAGDEFADLPSFSEASSDDNEFGGSPEFSEESSADEEPEGMPELSEELAADDTLAVVPEASEDFQAEDKLSGIPGLTEEPKTPEAVNEEILASIPEIDEEPLPFADQDIAEESEEEEQTASSGRGLFQRRRRLSSVEQLKAIVKDEPDSLDDDEISREKYITPTEQGGQIAAEPLESIGDEAVELPPMDGGFDEEDGLPAVPVSEEPEAVEVRDPDDFGIDGFDLGEPVSEPALPTGDGSLSPPMNEIDTIDDGRGDVGFEAADLSVPDKTSSDVSLPSVDDDFGLGEVAAAPMNLDDATFEEPAEEASSFMSASDMPEESLGGSDDIELSDKELKKLKKAILLFNPGLRNAIIDVIVNDKLAPSDTRKLVDSVLNDLPEDKLSAFLQDLTGEPIPVSAETQVHGRRVIHARPEYMRDGRERQKRRLKLAGFMAASAVLAFILTICGYQYIYKPVTAKNKIDEGVALILRSGDYASKNADFRAAEALAAEVEELYQKGYVYGYNAYGMAYLKKKDYQRAYAKLNTAYKLGPQNIETLLNLGEFFAKAPAAFYASVKSQVKENYYPENDGKDRDISQLDLAINFYRRVLTLDPKEVKALYGIGNAYFVQKQFLKAKNFYSDILKVDPDSVVGYSGLLNLYIERDVYDLAAATHGDLRHKKLLNKIPLPLLAKLANYYLGKNKTDTFNVRVDHAVQSPRLKDNNDNTFPAVKNLLDTINSVDSSYPPLMLLLAKVGFMQSNLKVAELYLKRAVDVVPDYFDALHLMGKFSYETNQPVQAYRYLTRAVRAADKQPDFTEEDFYKGTETVGESYAILGNIFYYYFDKVRYRFGDLEDEILDKELEKMANYNIARERYETAVKEGFANSEVRYNLGRIHYLNRQYSKSLEQWLYLYDDFTANPELMLALGNAFYHLGQYDASRGEFLRLINALEHASDGISVVDRNNKDQIRIFRSMASAYNNLGAVYQLNGDESKSSVSYWKAIDYAKRLEIENEFARVNLARSFNRRSNAEPILDENVPYSIRHYSADMR